jgi:cysteine desulfurase
MNVYFDNAATTSMRKEVIEEMTKVMMDSFGNPSSTHSFGRKAKSHIETARKSIASMLNADPQEIIFTSGGTESDNMILNGVVNDLGVKTLISSPIEHHAVLQTLENLKKNKKIAIKYVSVLPDGSIDLNHLEFLLQEDTSLKLVTLMHVNNEIGNILDIDYVSFLCKKHNVYFHTDAVQGVGHFEINLKKNKVDFLSAAAHKFHGPKGIGFSFIRKNSGLKPFIYGGAQERGMRAGTESVHNIVGMKTALEISYKNLKTERLEIINIKKYFHSKLKKTFPDLIINGLSGSEKQSTYTLINVTLPIEGDHVDLIQFNLDIKGIACSKGSACQSGSNSGSHVLNEIQKKSIKSKPSFRFSFCHTNTKEEVDYVVAVLKGFKQQN